MTKFELMVSKRDSQSAAMHEAAREKYTTQLAEAKAKGDTEAARYYEMLLSLT